MPMNQMTFISKINSNNFSTPQRVNYKNMNPVKQNFRPDFLNAIREKLFSNIGREPINTTLQQN